MGNGIKSKIYTFDNLLTLYMMEVQRMETVCRHYNAINAENEAPSKYATAVTTESRTETARNICMFLSEMDAS